ncbi:MAG: HAMP domain-containing sensor histidine kinase [Bacteroidales bacterium]
MGLQSIRQEQNRQEEIFIENLEQSLAIAISRVETDVEEGLHALMSNLPVYGLMRGRNFFQQIRHVINHSSLVEDVFVLDMNMHVYYPRKHLHAGGVQRPLSYQDQVFFQQGEAFEARGSLEDAVNQYRKGLQESGSVLQTLALLNGIARCQVKMNQLPEARVNFREIIELDRGRFLGSEVPFVFLAYYQLADIEARLRSSAAALNVMLDFYELLVDNFHHLRAAQHSFYISGVKEKIQSMPAEALRTQASRYMVINEREKATEDERSFRVLFDNHLLPVCRNYIQLPGEGSALKFIRLKSREDFSVIAMKAIYGESQTDVIQGIVLNEDEVSRLLVSVVESHNANNDINIFLLHPGGSQKDYVGLEEDSSILSAGFTEISDLFPGHSLGISLGDNPGFENIFKRTIRLYYLLFAAIIGVILLGIVFIFRDIYREQQFSQLRSSFIANVSHEIKTPIASLRVLAGNLSEGLIIRQERQKEYFRLINREAERLSYLTENLLDFSSMEARRKVYRKELINLNDLFRKVLRRFFLMHQEKELVIHQSIPSGLPDIMASPEGLEQAVLNLLDNAAKYSGPNKSIGMSLKQDNKEAVISVWDNGIGIAQSEQKKIFEKFYRVNNKEQKKPGSGIGLSLVKEIAQMHNGSIEVESEPGKGSKFSLIIPVNHAKDITDRG